MRDQDERVRVGFEIRFEPVAGFQIQVVGRFVEQQQVWLLEQKFRERNAHLPAAGKLFHAPLPIVAAESEPGKHGTDARFDVVAIARCEFRLDVVITIGDQLVFGALVIELAHAPFERLLLFLEQPDFIENREALVEDGPPAERDAILREVACTDTFHRVDRAVIETFDSA